VLVYGHYDVQPPTRWTNGCPPVRATRRDGNLYARGATDDKGQMLTHVKSAEAWMQTAGRLPVQLKFLIEGEEEVGSEGGRIDRAGDRSPRLHVVVISDSSQFGRASRPLRTGSRGSRISNCD